MRIHQSIAYFLIAFQTISTSTFASPPTNDAARQQGISDGGFDGAQEGRERGESEGSNEGRERGFLEGRDRCSRDLAQRNYDQGFANGTTQGLNEGDTEGRAAGEAQGRAEGMDQGAADGRARASEAARNASAGPGADRGREQANHSDATERGHADGMRAGDQQAHDQATNQDYPAAREAYRRARFATTPQFEDSISLGTTTNAISSAVTLNEAKQSRAQYRNANPDFRYFRPRATFPDANDASTYNASYRQGYIESFGPAYNSTYDMAFRSAHREGEYRGCRIAERQDYSDQFNRGFAEGRQRGHDEGYQRSFESARTTARNAVFPLASSQAYDSSYQGYYDQFFEAARLQAYQQQVDALYHAAFDESKQAQYNSVYPQYLRQETARAQTDEANDFENRPIRIIAASTQDSNQNGLYEPDENLTLQLRLRNFSQHDVNGSDVMIRIQTSDNRTYVGLGQTTLPRRLRGNSLTAVSNALSFRFPEALVDTATSVTVSVTYQGRDAGSISMELTPKYRLKIELTETPTIREGITTPLHVRVTNQSPLSALGSAIVQLRTNTQIADVSPAQMSVSILNPGESRDLEFTLLGRSDQTEVELALAFEAFNLNERLGALNVNPQVPVSNDYRIEVNQNLASLRQTGLTRISYNLRNVSSRLLFSSLSLEVRVRMRESGLETALRVLGPNPQFAFPIPQGSLLHFVVPVMVSATNSGGTLDLVVKENGRDVVIHSVAF